MTTGYFDANEKDYDYINLKVSNIGQEPKAYQKIFGRSQATVVTSQDLFKACACTSTYEYIFLVHMYLNLGKQKHGNCY